MSTRQMDPYTRFRLSIHYLEIESESTTEESYLFVLNHVYTLITNLFLGTLASSPIGWLDLGLIQSNYGDAERADQNLCTQSEILRFFEKIIKALLDTTYFWEHKCRKKTNP